MPDNENNEPMAPGEMPDHEQDEVPGETQRQPVNSIVTGPITVTVGDQTFAPLGMVTSWLERGDGGGTVVTERGTPALERLDEVSGRLTRAVSYSGGAMLVALPENSIITEINIYNHAMEPCVRDKNTAIAPELHVGEYLVEVGIRRMRADGTGEYVEYLFLLTVEENATEQPLYVTAGKVPFVVTGYPLYKSYYDSESGEQVNVEMPGATANLEALHDELPLVTLIQEKSFDLIPVTEAWEFASLDLYDDQYGHLGTYTDEAYRTEIPHLDPQVYAVVATYTVRDGDLEMAVEFPFRLAIHEKEVETVREPNLESEPETELVHQNNLTVEEMQEKLGCYVGTVSGDNLQKLMAEGNQKIRVEHEDYSSNVFHITTIQNGTEYTNTITLSKEVRVPDIYCGFTSEQNGYIMIFHMQDYSVSAMDDIELAGVLITTDGGKSWSITEYQDPPSVPGRDYINAACFFTDQTGFFTARYYVRECFETRTYWTMDGGKTWKQMPKLVMPDVFAPFGTSGLGYATEISDATWVDGVYTITVRICNGYSYTVDGDYSIYLQYSSTDLENWTLVK